MNRAASARRIVACLVLAATASSPWAVAQGAPLAEVELGFRGSPVADAWNPVRVVLRDVGTGEAVLTIDQGSLLEGELPWTVVLPIVGGGGVRVLDVDVFLPAWRTLRWTVDAGGLRLASGALARSDADRRPVDLVVSSRAGEVAGTLGGRALDVAAADLPARAAAYGGVRSVWLDGTTPLPDPRVLAAAAAGGAVVVVQGSARTNAALAAVRASAVELGGWLGTGAGGWWFGDAPDGAALTAARLDVAALATAFAAADAVDLPRYPPPLHVALASAAYVVLIAVAWRVGGAAGGVTWAWIVVAVGVATVVAWRPSQAQVVQQRALHVESGGLSLRQRAFDVVTLPAATVGGRRRREARLAAAGRRAPRFEPAHRGRARPLARGDAAGGTPGVVRGPGVGGGRDPAGRGRLRPVERPHGGWWGVAADRAGRGARGPDRPDAARRRGSDLRGAAPRGERVGARWRRLARPAAGRRTRRRGGAPVSPWRGVSERLRAGDLPQIGLLGLSAVAVVLVASWPARPGLPHEGWYAVAQTRSVVVALIAVGYGAGLFLEAPRRMAATAGAVLVVALSTLPFELAAHGASAPATPAWWALVATPIAVAGQLTLGAAIGAVARRLRLGSLLFVIVPAAIVGAVVFDVRVGATILNPLTAALQVAPGYLLAHAVLGALGVLLWARRLRTERAHRRMSSMPLHERVARRWTRARRTTAAAVLAAVASIAALALAVPVGVHAVAIVSASLVGIAWPQRDRRQEALRWIGTRAGLAYETAVEAGERSDRFGLFDAVRTQGRLAVRDVGLPPASPWWLPAALLAATLWAWGAFVGVPWVAPWLPGGSAPGAPSGSPFAPPASAEPGEAPPPERAQAEDPSAPRDDEASAGAPGGEGGASDGGGEAPGSSSERDALERFVEGLRQREVDPAAAAAAAADEGADGEPESGEESRRGEAGEGEDGADAGANAPDPGGDADPAGDEASDGEGAGDDRRATPTASRARATSLGKRTCPATGPPKTPAIERPRVRMERRPAARGSTRARIRAMPASAPAKRGRRAARSPRTRDRRTRSRPSSAPVRRPPSAASPCPAPMARRRSRRGRPARPSGERSRTRSPRARSRCPTKRSSATTSAEDPGPAARASGVDRGRAPVGATAGQVGEERLELPRRLPEDGPVEDHPVGTVVRCREDDVVAGLQRAQQHVGVGERCGDAEGVSVGDERDAGHVDRLRDRAAVRAHQPARAELDAPEPPGDGGGHAIEAALLEHLEHGAAGRPAGFPIVRPAPRRAPERRPRHVPRLRVGGAHGRHQRLGLVRPRSEARRSRRSASP